MLTGSSRRAFSPKASNEDEQHNTRQAEPGDLAERQSPQFAIIGEDDGTEEDGSPTPRDMRYDGAFDEERNVWDS